MNDRLVYVSRAGSGTIATYRIDAETERLQHSGEVEAAAGVMPLALDTSAYRLFAMTRAAPYALFTFAIDRATGALRRIGKRPLAHSYVQCAWLPSRAALLGASYGDGFLSQIDLQDARGGPALDGDVAENWRSLAGRHPHCVIATADGTQCYVAFLGDDTLHHYAFDGNAGHPVKIGEFAVDAQTGPRHGMLSADERRLYVLGELSGVVWVFSRDVHTGQLTPCQQIASIPAASGLRPGVPRAPGVLSAAAEDLIWSADIKLTPDGRFLYTSERSSGTISRFIVDGVSGTLRFTGTENAAKGIRSLAITAEGDYLLAASPSASRIQLYKIDQSDGALHRVDDCVCSDAPAWIETLTLSPRAALPR